MAIDLDIEEEGYLYTYVSNESNWDVDVHFDEMMVAAASSAPVIVQSQDYYPFGLTHTQPLNDLANKYLFNGKELTSALGLQWYDYGARMYDPTVGRFTTQDRFAAKYYDLSPYQYTANNPINFVDINGDSIWIANGDERFLYTAGTIYKGDDEFIGKAVSDLNKIGGTKKGAKRIGDLTSSKSNYNIKKAPQLTGRTGSRYEGNSDGGGDIYYYQEGGSYDGVSFDNSEFSIGHELQHAWDHDQGKEEYFTTKTKGVKTSEINAVAFENYLRAEAGETDMRTMYDKNIIFNNSNPSYFLNKADPLRRNEGYFVPDFYRSPATDATFVAPNTRAIRINTKTGKYVDPTQ